MAKRKRSNKTAPTEATSEASLPTPVAETFADTAEPTVAELAPDEVTPAAEPLPDAAAPTTSEGTAEASAPTVEPAPVEAPDAAPAADADSAAWPEPTPPPEAPPEAWAWPDDSGDGAAPSTAQGQPAEDGPGTDQGQPVPEGARLASVIESLLFASDKPLTLTDLRRLLGIREGKKITAALDELTEQRMGSGIEVAALSTGWMLRTNPENAPWVSKLLVGKPLRLSRAMLETLAIVAYRQPVTRPEIDDIRGVDCGPVLKTLLDRGLVRIIGKKEEVGRPLLYGTTPEFLRIFNLRELAELPTLREFYDLSAEDQSRVEAEHGAPAAPPSAISPKPEVALGSVSRGELPPEPEETDPLIEELDEASQLAKKALGTLDAREAEEAPADADKTSTDRSEGSGSSVAPSGE